MPWPKLTTVSCLEAIGAICRFVKLTHGISESNERTGNDPLLDPNLTNYNTGNRIKFEDLGAYTTGDLLKRFLSELPVPLIPKETFKRLTEIKSDDAKREEETIAVLQTLTHIQAATLEVVLQMCK